MSNVVVKHVTIANGQSLSGALPLADGECPFMIVMPSAWTTAGLTFQVSIDGTNYANLYDSVGEYTIASATASVAIGLGGIDPFYGAGGIKVRSGTSGAPVAQGAERKIYIVCRRIQ